MRKQASSQVVLYLLAIGGSGSQELGPPAALRPQASVALWSSSLPGTSNAATPQDRAGLWEEMPLWHLTEPEADVKKRRR